MRKIRFPAPISTVIVNVGPLPSSAPDAEGEALLRQAITRLNLSARAYHRVLKVARTIADLANSLEIQTAHIAEAVQYRRMDRQG